MCDGIIISAYNFTTRQRTTLSIFVQSLVLDNHCEKWNDIQCMQKEQLDKFYIHSISLNYSQWLSRKVILLMFVQSLVLEKKGRRTSTRNTALTLHTHTLHVLRGWERKAKMAERLKQKKEAIEYNQSLNVLAAAAIGAESTHVHTMSLNRCCSSSLVVLSFSSFCCCSAAAGRNSQKSALSSIHLASLRES